MVAIGISEFTFGYAFLYEQTHTNWGALKAAPILPSLQAEEEQGWDAHLPLNGTDFYYQFKLTERLSRSNALYIANGTYTGPYYRIALHRRENNRQHQRLRTLAQTNPNVFYVAPEFDSVDDFNAAFLSQQLTSRSRLIPVSQCQDYNDPDQHYITFQHNQQQWNEHSERRSHKEGTFRGDELAEVYGGSSLRWRKIDRTFAQHLFERTAEVVSRAVTREERQRRAVTLPLLD